MSSPPPTPTLAGPVQGSHPPEPPLRASEDNPNAQLVKTLREQIDDLLQQVSQLNGKLVQSYDRVSDLEDTLHVTSSNLRSSTLKISELEIDRAQHLSALNTGLLVERSTITTELTRLMERVTEETAQRGMAENAKQEIEKDLDDLSANLFNQANTMVAEARYARAMSERKADGAENALHSAEEVVSVLQTQMQTLTQDKERSEKEAEELRQLMGKGKWVPNDSAPSPMDLAPRLSTAYLPYQEFLLFNSHVRSIRLPRELPPSIVALVQLPFLMRLQVEDSDPTLRLDFAPSLNFLTRRSVQTAIHTGQLTIEPVPSNRLTSDSTLASSILGPATLHDLTCALCGKHIFTPQPNDLSRGRRAIHQASASWVSTSRFFKSQAGLSVSNPSSPVSPDSLPSGIPAQTYVFRVSLPPAPNQKPSTTYPLCHNGFCLKRLRSTCALWHFVRESVITHVWNEPEAPTMAPPLHPRSSVRSLSYGSLIGRSTTPTAPATSTTADTSPAPTRRGVTSRVGNLWASGFGALGTSSRSASPVPDPPSPTSNVNTDTQHVPAVPPRRVPPISTDISSRTSTETEAPAPPLPPRRRPVSDGRPTVDDPAERVETPPLDDVATMRSGTREESGLLTPASESEGFRTPPGSGRSSPVVEEHDLIHNRALSTELPVSRPTSLALDPIAANSEGLETPKPAIAHEVAVTEMPDPTPSPFPPTSDVAVIASSAAPPPPPLPRRAAARAVVVSPTTSRAASPAPIAPSPGVEGLAGIEAKAVPTESSLVQPEILFVQDSGSTTEPSTPTASAGPIEKARSVISESSNYSSEVGEVLRKDLAIIPPAAPPLPPRRSSNAVLTDDVQPSLPNSSGPAESFADSVSWEEKTWKELVRLREDMFWARMGGLRGSEDDTQTSS